MDDQRPRLDLRAQARDAAEDFKDFAVELRAWLRGGAKTLSGERSRALAQSFRAWADVHFDDPPLHAWIAALSDEGLLALSLEVSRFCSSLGFELAWLVEGELADEPELEARARAIVVLYCQACYHALEAHDGFARFARRRRWASGLPGGGTPNRRG